MSGKPVGQPVEILLVEDNPGDVRLAQEALRDSDVASNLTVAVNGEDALAFLRRQGKYSEAPRPNLILLDLRLPKKQGLEVLAEIKADPVLRSIPVVVLTASDASDDILKAYDLQASCYVTKPEDPDEFDRAMKSIKDFCLTVVKLPPRD